MPPRRGLAGTWLGRREVTFRTPDGGNIRCRLQDATGVVSVYVDREYAYEGINWSSLSTVLDIGAHVGSFTVWIARRCPNARIIAVEPNPFIFRYLLANISRNGISARVRSDPTALGASKGVGWLAVDELSVKTRVVSRGRTAALRVEVQTLAELLDKAGVTDVDLVKMDCEGAEYEILMKSPDSTLRRIRALLCEYHPAPDYSVSDLVKRLSALGFHVKHSHALQGILYAVQAEPI